MIYIVTPYLTDVVKTCVREGIQCPVSNGKLLNHNIAWIYDWQQLMGRKIMKIDRIYYGEQHALLNKEMIHRINIEFQIRKFTT